MAEYILRFLAGGFVVSAFATLGDILRPKSFAQHGPAYAAVQTRAMIAGALALSCYSILVCQLLMRARMRALPATLLAFLLWLAVAFGLALLLLGAA
jgi:hypothetical protein